MEWWLVQPNRQTTIVVLHPQRERVTEKDVEVVNCEKVEVKEGDTEIC